LVTSQIGSGLCFLPDRALARAPEGSLTLARRPGHVVAVVLETGGTAGAPDVEALCPDGTAVPIRLPTRPPDLDALRRTYAAHGLDPTPIDDAAAGRSPRSLVPSFFFYGTLMRGEARHPAVLRHAPMDITSATCPGRLVDLGDYPGMLLDVESSGTVVRGELVRFADERLAQAVERFDAIEGFRGFGVTGSLYVRQLVHVITRDGSMILAWTYLYAGAVGRARAIPSSDWRLRGRSG
jgi:gamma-glutamylcyclotransferase (GGCT)/AIG2-like uncharacterized protein YtfP